MKAARRGLSWLFVLFCMAGWPLAAAAQAETLRIAMPKSLVFMPAFAAQTLGLYAAQGLRVEIIDLPGPKASQAMVEGQADLSATFAERPITFLREGKAIKNVMALLDQNPIVLVAHRDAPARKVAELKGMRIGSTVPKAGTDLALRWLLKDAGLDTQRDVTLEYLGVGGLISGIRERKVDALIMPADFAAQVIEQYKVGRALVDPRRDGPAFVREMNFSTLQASDAGLKAKPEAIGRAVRAVVQAQKRLREDADLAQKLALEYFPQVDPAVIKAILDIDRPTYRAAITEAQMQKVHDGLRGAALPADDPPIPFAQIVAVQYRALWQ